MTLETEVPGTPGSINPAATWLRGELRSGAESLANISYRQRSQSSSAWDGDAGDAFRGRASTLAKASDGLGTEASSVAGTLDTLAAAMTRLEDAMDTARTRARGGDLTVAGTVIHDPGPAPADVPDLPAGSTPAQATAHSQAVAKVRAYNAKVDLYDELCEFVSGRFDDYGQALREAAETWRGNDANLTSLVADLLTAAATSAFVLTAAPIMAKQSAFQTDMASRMRGHAAEATKSGRLAGMNRQHYYDLLDSAAEADQKAVKAAESARNFKVPKGVTRGLGVLGVLATGYAIKSDMEDGESAAQASVSNGAGMIAAIGASAVAGTYIGGVAGSFIPIPGVGTAVGVVAGAVVGTVVGTFTSGAIDSVWKHGMDSTEDVWTAAVDGAKEIGKTAKSVGDLAEGAWDALF